MRMFENSFGGVVVFSGDMREGKVRVARIVVVLEAPDEIPTFDKVLRDIHHNRTGDHRMNVVPRHPGGVETRDLIRNPALHVREVLNPGLQSIKVNFRAKSVSRELRAYVIVVLAGKHRLTAEIRRMNVGA